MNLNLHVNNLTFIPKISISEEQNTLANIVYSKINFKKYIGNGLNIFSHRYLNNLNSVKKLPMIIENFYNDKYFFFRSEIKEIEKEVNLIVDEWVKEYLEDVDNKNIQISKAINYFKNNSNNSIHNKKLDTKNLKYSDINKMYYELTILKMINDINALVVKRLSYHKKYLTLI